MGKAWNVLVYMAGDNDLSDEMVWGLQDISRKTREELLDAIRARYRKASKNGKGRILDDNLRIFEGSGEREHLLGGRADHDAVVHPHAEKVILGNRDPQRPDGRVEIFAESYARNRRVFHDERAAGESIGEIEHHQLAAVSPR